MDCPGVLLWWQHAHMIISLIHPSHAIGYGPSLRENQYIKIIFRTRLIPIDFWPVTKMKQKKSNQIKPNIMRKIFHFTQRMINRTFKRSPIEKQQQLSDFTYHTGSSRVLLSHMRILMRISRLTRKSHTLIKFFDTRLLCFAWRFFLLCRNIRCIFFSENLNHFFILWLKKAAKLLSAESLVYDLAEGINIYACCILAIRKRQTEIEVEFASKSNNPPNNMQAIRCPINANK